MTQGSNLSVKNPFTRAAGETYDTLAQDLGVSPQVANTMRQLMAMKIAGFLPSAPQFELGSFLKTLFKAGGLEEMSDHFKKALEAITPLDSSRVAQISHAAKAEPFSPQGPG